MIRFRDWIGAEDHACQWLSVGKPPPPVVPVEKLSHTVVAPVSSMGR